MKLKEFVNSQAETVGKWQNTIVATLCRKLKKRLD